MLQPQTRRWCWRGETGTHSASPALAGVRDQGVWYGTVFRRGRFLNAELFAVRKPATRDGGAAEPGAPARRDAQVSQRRCAWRSVG